MTKVKLSLPSGSEVEKTVLSYFNNGGNYIIFDAESVGSMGLPIILVSKVVNDKVEKINDQNEWQQAKGFLKSIISGESVNYLTAPESMGADEVYYTQLTLPVASFDALKNAYANINGSNSVADSSVDNATTSVESTPSDMPDSAPVIDPLAANMSAPATPDESMEPVNMSTSVEASPSDNSAEGALDSEPAIANPIIAEEPIANEGLTASVEPVVPQDSAMGADTPVGEPVVAETENPVNEPAIEEPVITNDASPIVNEQPTIEIDNAVAPDTPSNDVAIADNGTIIDNAAKEKFMRACEDLFDAISSMK